MLKPDRVKPLNGLLVALSFTLLTLTLRPTLARAQIPRIVKVEALKSPSGSAEVKFKASDKMYLRFTFDKPFAQRTNPEQDHIALDVAFAPRSIVEQQARNERVDPYSGPGFTADIPLDAPAGARSYVVGVLVDPAEFKPGYAQHMMASEMVKGIKPANAYAKSEVFVCNRFSAGATIAGEEPGEAFAWTARSIAETLQIDPRDGLAVLESRVQQLSGASAKSVDVPAAKIKDPSAEAAIVKRVKRNNPAATDVKVVLTSEWTLERHEISGAVLSRWVLVALVVKEKSGCTLETDTGFRQPFLNRKFVADGEFMTIATRQTQAIDCGRAFAKR